MIVDIRDQETPVSNQQQFLRRVETDAHGAAVSRESLRISAFRPACEWSRVAFDKANDLVLGVGDVQIPRTIDRDIDRDVQKCSVAGPPSPAKPGWPRWPATIVSCPVAVESRKMTCNPLSAMKEVASRVNCNASGNGKAMAVAGPDATCAVPPPATTSLFPVVRSTRYNDGQHGSNKERSSAIQCETLRCRDLGGRRYGAGVRVHSPHPVILVVGEIEVAIGVARQAVRLSHRRAIAAFPFCGIARDTRAGVGRNEQVESAGSSAQLI